MAICFSTPHYLPLNNAPGNLITGRLFTNVFQQYTDFLQAWNISPALLKRRFKDAGVQGASYLQLFMKWEQAREQTRQLILWNVRGNRRATIHGGVGEKLSKIALIHIHMNAEHSLLLTRWMINRRQAENVCCTDLVRCPHRKNSDFRWKGCTQKLWAIPPTPE